MKPLTIAEADALVASCKKQLEDAMREASLARVAYAKERPLTPAEHARLIERVRNGGALCCADGKAWLLTFLPEPWAEALNGWAYEALACKTPNLRDEWVSKVKALRRDRFPVVFD